jgi:signal transduction histidine kinase
VQRVRSAAQHLLELIDETLTFARLEAGQEEVRPVSGVACSALVEEAAALVEPLAMERGLEFRAAAPQPDVEMTVDARKVRQVLVNLLGNAIKFTARGSVALTAERDGGDVRFRVADTGPGIAAEHAERIFDPFWQVEQSTIRTHGGSGLGLSVARQLARLMGGDVTVQSTPGEGSVFTIRIPIAPAEE